MLLAQSAYHKVLEHDGRIIAFIMTFSADADYDSPNFLWWFSKPGLGPCEVFHEGQEFFMEDPWTMPEGFCSGAWTDIAKNVQTICLGGEFPSAMKKGTNISCCVDGVRPVIFKIERLGESV